MSSRVKESFYYEKLWLRLDASFQAVHAGSRGGKRGRYKPFKMRKLKADRQTDG